MFRAFYFGCNARIADGTVLTVPRSQQQRVTGIVNPLYHRGDAEDDNRPPDGFYGTVFRSPVPLLPDDHTKTLTPYPKS